MDREIPKEQLQKERNRRLTYIFIGVAAVVILFLTLWFAIDTSVPESNLRLATAETGTIESSVTASGRISPLHEQTIVSPVSTKIMELFCTEGDTVEIGQALMRLDLQATETEVRRLADQANMHRNEIERTILDNQTFLTDLEMRIKAKELAVNHSRAEVANERRLDSIGSGTGDRIRQAQLAYETALMELEQMKTQLANERKSHDATLRTRQLEGAISQRTLMEAERTLDDARVKAPIKGTVSYLNKSLGTSIASGERLAVVSDMSHFKINGEIPEANVGKISIGSPVVVKAGSRSTRGHIANISPQSNNGVTEFSIRLDNDSDPMLRAGLRVDLSVVYDVKENIVRIPNGPYFQGPGEYNLFVMSSPGILEKRRLELGDSNFDFVEVSYGLKPGETVVISDMSEFVRKNRISIKK